MSVRLLAPAALAVLLLTVPSGATAQASPASPGASSAPTPTEDAKPSRRSRKARDGASKKEPAAGGVAASERRKKCGAEWKEAKAAGKTAGLKWPKFYSRCNARLKGSSA